MFNVAHKIVVESEICMVKKNLSVAKIKALYVCNWVQCPEDSHCPVQSG